MSAVQLIDPAKLAQVTTLARGVHDFGERMCAMEAVAFVAGEPWSDHPQCASQVIGAFMRTWNDSLPNGDRDRILLPLIPRLVGTAGSVALEQRRATMAADWLIRVHTPAWLRLAKLDAQAESLERLPEITDFASCPSLMPVLNAVRQNAAAARDAARAAAWDAARAAAGDAAWAAAGAAAGDAAWAAARAAAGDAAWAAAGDAAWAAAWDAARAAARDAAWDAARAAARDAAWAALADTKVKLQQSAAELVIGMCEVTEQPA